MSAFHLERLVNEELACYLNDEVAVRIWYLSHPEGSAERELMKRRDEAWKKYMNACDAATNKECHSIDDLSPSCYSENEMYALRAMFSAQELYNELDAEYMQMAHKAMNG